MSVLPPLPVAIPLIAAAALAAVRPARPPKRITDLAAIVTAVAVAVVCLVLLAQSADGTIAYYVGGFGPGPGPPLGIALVIDPISAGLASFAAITVVAALVLTSISFDSEMPFFRALVLIFLAAMVGFALTGDLFNLFVFFELMSVVAYALTGYRVEHSAPLQGALGFAVVDGLGGFMIVAGIGLLYGRTGQLNLAQIGESLAGGGPDGLTIVAFTLLAAGFFTKAAVVPFHFWLADAYAVAATPVCLVFSAAMSELGLYGIARLWFTVFEPALGSGVEGVRTVLLVAGVVTALVGGVMCFAQDLLKRMLAFATISHVGLFLLGLALLGPGGIAGMAVLIVADGFVKAALFVCVGILEHRRDRGVESGLRGLGRGLWATGLVVTAGGLAFASLPPFGPFLGKAMIEDAGLRGGLEWLPWVMIAASALTGGAVLRFGASVFLGWGPQRRPEPWYESSRAGRDVGAEGAVAPGGRQDELGSTESRDRTPSPMIATASLLVLAGLALGVVPGLAEAFESAAARFADRPGYVAAVLGGALAPLPGMPRVALTSADYVYAAATVALAFALAAGALWRERIPSLLRDGPGRGGARALRVLRLAHSGQIGDYVAWFTLGTAMLGGALALALAP